MANLLYSLSTSLEQFKGDDGFRRFVDAGKLSFLSFFSNFEQTKDELFEKRSIAVMNTRKCMVALHTQMEDVARASDSLVRKMGHMVETFSEFHKCCDLQVKLCYQENQPEEDHDTFEQCFHSLDRTHSQIKDSLRDFVASQVTCRRMLASALSQLEQVDTNACKSVGQSQVRFDLQRRKVQSSERELLSARSNSGGHSSVEASEALLRRESDILQSVGDAYISSLRSAMHSTGFAFEQTSMATWAACNVFFVQVGALFKDCSVFAETSAESVNKIKNHQKVSQNLTEAKRIHLDCQRSLFEPTHLPSENNTCMTDQEGYPNLLDIPPTPEDPAVAASSIDVDELFR